MQFGVKKCVYVFLIMQAFPFFPNNLKHFFSVKKSDLYHIARVEKEQLTCSKQYRHGFLLDIMLFDLYKAFDQIESSRKSYFFPSFDKEKLPLLKGSGILIIHLERISPCRTLQIDLGRKFWDMHQIHFSIPLLLIPGILQSLDNRVGIEIVERGVVVVYHVTIV